MHARGGGGPSDIIQLSDQFSSVKLGHNIKYKRTRQGLEKLGHANMRNQLELNIKYGIEHN